MIRTVSSLALAALLTGLVACGSTPPPRAEVAKTEAALQAAELAGAREYAPIELRTAEESKAALDDAMAKEDYERAQLLADRALTDAELAKAKAESEKSRLALKEVQDGIQLLRTEVGRAAE